MHMEGQESSELDPSQGKLQKDLDYAHIPIYVTIREYLRMYAVIREKAAYINFLMFLGMIKDTSKDKKWSIGANESAAGQGKAIQCVIHLVW